MMLANALPEMTKPQINTVQEWTNFYSELLLPSTDGCVNIYATFFDDTLHSFMFFF